MSKRDRKLISVAAYARHRGCSASAVKRALTEGRITREPGGIDPALADEQWRANTRPRSRNAPADPVSFAESRARREAAEAKLAELKLAEQQRRVVDADAVTREWSKLLGTCKARLLVIPAKIAPRVTHVTVAEAAGTIEREILQALHELSGDGLPR